jgi:RNA polymerase sigma factor (TIGR02999 family)
VEQCIKIVLMSGLSQNDVTRILQAWNLGQEDALEQLVPVVYRELHRLARTYMKGERQGHLLQTTALINEAYLRLADLQRIQWKNRDQFYGIAAQMMRRILVDFARARQSKKRGGGVRQVTLNEAVPGGQEVSVDLLALDEALNELVKLDERKGKVVELRYFGELSVTETASALGVSPETVMRDWKFSKAWLCRRLKSAEDSTAHQ